MKEAMLATAATALLLLSSGCARFVGAVKAPDGSETRFRAFTFFDSKNDLAKLALRQTTTNKTLQSFGIGSASQESSASNIVTILSIGADGAIKALKP
jgi:hypothetical protein